MSGSTVYAGGEFSNIGGQIRSRIGAVDAGTGLATAWNPSANLAVHALAVSGSTVYAGGDFTSIGGQTRNRIAALNTTNGLATAWNPNAGGRVNAVAVGGSTVYAGGDFTSIGGQARNNIAGLDIATGLANAWNPDADSFLNTLVVSGSTVYVGGHFTMIGGQQRSRIGALDAATGLATAWDPRAQGTLNYPPDVLALAVSGSTVYAGGRFTGMGGALRNHIAALDAVTGQATAWDPNANNVVNTLALNGSTVYAGGTFTTIGGQARDRIAALDAGTGLATSWNPDANNDVNTLAVNGSTVYAGGRFTNVGGQARNRIAAIDAATGAATAWNPNASSDVFTLAANGSAVYAGGQFTNIGGQARLRIAAIDAATGLATAWNPSANNFVYCVVVSGASVYAGGRFTNIGGQARNRIAALTVTSGSATAWNPDADADVLALSVNGFTLYAGGRFSVIGGQTRLLVAALDVTAGSVLAWNPSAGFLLSPSVNALAVGSSTVYAGGTFTDIGGRTYLAAIGGVPPPYSAASSGLPAINTFVSSAWGDFDGDGDLDLLVAGLLSGPGIVTRIYRNDSGTFVDIGAGLPGVDSGGPPSSGWTSWADFDGDGDLDAAFSGLDGTSTRRTYLYRNNGGTFVPVATGLPNLSNSSLAWGDFDRDGDSDLAISGYDGSASSCRIFRNDGGTFTDIGAGLPGSVGGLAWGDFDSDGDLDLAVEGTSISRVYRNDGGSFVLVFSPAAIGPGTVDWGDYDQDGDLDLLVASVAGVSAVYRNDGGGTFVNIGAALPTGSGPKGALWGDFDNDGALDILAFGAGVTAVLRNDAGTFVDMAAGLPGFGGPGGLGTTVADYDNDGRLDVLLSAAFLYHNDLPVANTPPTSPTNLSAVRSGPQPKPRESASGAPSTLDASHVTFSWEPSSDAQNAAAGLSYNLRLGTTPGGNEIASAMSTPSGRRLVVGPGNAQERTSITLSLPVGIYYWSVQAIDGAFSGSAFASAQTLDEVTAVEGSPEVPARFALSPAAPNPVRARTTFSFDVPRQETVRIELFDLAGRHVRTLMSGMRYVGRQTVEWDASDDTGHRVPAGVYDCRMRAGEFTANKRVLVLSH